MFRGDGLVIVGTDGDAPSGTKHSLFGAQLPSQPQFNRQPPSHFVCVPPALRLETTADAVGDGDDIDRNPGPPAPLLTTAHMQRVDMPHVSCWGCCHR